MTELSASVLNMGEDQAAVPKLSSEEEIAEANSEYGILYTMLGQSSSECR